MRSTRWRTLIAWISSVSRRTDSPASSSTTSSVEAQLAVDAPHRAHQLGEPCRPMNRQRAIAITQAERLQQARQSEPVVDVQVCDEDVGEVAQTRPRAAAVAGCPRHSRSGSAPPPAAPAAPAVPRRALGTDPAVPANITENSIAAERSAPAMLTASEARRAAPPAPVAQGIERSPPEREVAGSNPAGRVEEHPAKRPLLGSLRLRRIARGVVGDLGDHSSVVVDLVVRDRAGGVAGHELG